MGAPHGLSPGSPGACLAGTVTHSLAAGPATQMSVFGHQTHMGLNGLVPGTSFLGILREAEEVRWAALDFDLLGIMFARREFSGLPCECRE